MGKPISVQEIRELMDKLKWGTLIAIDDGQPSCKEDGLFWSGSCPLS